MNVRTAILYKKNLTVLLEESVRLSVRSGLSFFAHREMSITLFDVYHPPLTTALFPIYHIHADMRLLDLAVPGIL